MTHERRDNAAGIQDKWYVRSEQVLRAGDSQVSGFQSQALSLVYPCFPTIDTPQASAKPKCVSSIPFYAILSRYYNSGSTNYMVRRPLLAVASPHVRCLQILSTNVQSKPEKQKNTRQDSLETKYKLPVFQGAYRESNRNPNQNNNPTSW